jgi:tripartite-type tricarboxylate transporter receptor subunit TctC
MKRRQFQAGLLALAGGSALGSAHAQSRPGGPGGFPNKPIKLIVPYPAGGIVDAVMRAVSDPLSAELPQRTATISIAPQGHSAAHTPQPLQ